jgi:hypothetical protein
MQQTWMGIEREREYERRTWPVVEDEGAISPSAAPDEERAPTAAALQIGIEVDEEAAVLAPPSLASHLGPISRRRHGNPRKPGALSRHSTGKMREREEGNGRK